MTIFDLLFIALFFTASVVLILAAVSAVRGRSSFARILLRRLALSAAVYLGVVYLTTAISKQTVLHAGEPECRDDWCISVQDVKRRPGATAVSYDVQLRIFNRAHRRAQRENIVTDVYLVDSQWKRYDPILNGSEIALNVLLQPGESVLTSRNFELPVGTRDVGLKVGVRAGPGGPPICWIIGECDAFHKGRIIRLD